MDTREIIVLWRDGAWRCEFHPGFGGESRLLVYRGDHVAAAESTPSGEPALRRADALRQRVLRGDIRWRRTHRARDPDVPKRPPAPPEPPPEPSAGPSRISPDDSLSDVLERVVLRRQLRIEDGDVLIVRERVPRLDPYATVSLQWRFRVRVASEPAGTAYAGFQHAASAAEQLADERRARVIYLEDDVPTLLADHRG